MSDEPEELNSQGILDSSVVALDDHRPHTAGTARCVGTCQHEWVAVAPERRRTDIGLECPSCRRMDGYYLFSEGEFRQWLCSVAQLLDGWHGDGTAWSEWDESIRADCPRAHVTLDALTATRTPQPASEPSVLANKYRENGTCGEPSTNRDSRFANGTSMCMCPDHLTYPRGGVPPGPRPLGPRSSVSTSRGRPMSEQRMEHDRARCRAVNGTCSHPAVPPPAEQGDGCEYGWCDDSRPHSTRAHGPSTVKACHYELHQLRTTRTPQPTNRDSRTANAVPRSSQGAREEAHRALDALIDASTVECLRHYATKPAKDCAKCAEEHASLATERRLTAAIAAARAEEGV